MKTTFSVFWGVMFAVLAIVVVGILVASSRHQTQEDQGVDDICRRMAATGGGSCADCKAQMKKQGY